jgi:integrase
MGNMRVRRFTAISIEAIKPQAMAFEATDGSGLRLFVSPTGAKSFGWRYRRPDNGLPAKLTLGKWPTTTLAAARVALEKARLDLEQGRDPGGAKRQAKVDADLAQGGTLRSIAEEHLRYEEAKRDPLRTIGQRRATFERVIYDEIGGRPIHEIRRGEVVKLMDKVEAERGPRMADEVLSVLSILFRWHAIRDESFRSPLVPGMNRTTPKGRMRTRVLDDGELRRVWIACEGLGAFGAFIKFLLLTATRRNESAHAIWSEVLNGVWRIPAERFKSEREHVVPLSRAAQDLLASVPRIADCDFIFTNDGQRAIGGFSAAKRKLDEASGVVGWRLHDLRRVARSLLSRAGIANDIAEMCLGHSIGGLRATYDQYRYESEKRHALEALSAQIERIVNPTEDNVVPMRR